jgi:hypothetical protein
MHEVEESTCADCRPRTAASAPPRSRSQLRRRAALQDDGPGPWFEATFPGECSSGGCDIEPGDQIRADGSGGWECKECQL